MIDPLGAVHWEFIDDLGVGGLVEDNEEPEDLLTLRQLVRDAFLEMGVELHKEEMGKGLQKSLGMATTTL